jgi:hypothetical protein
MHGNTGQLASGFLVEVGNGEQDKFIFDLGTGAYINLWATGVPMAKLTKVCGGGRGRGAVGVLQAESWGLGANALPQYAGCIP